MTPNEYEQKKSECWSEYTRRCVHEGKSAYGAFCFAFDHAYALGKQKKDAEKLKKPKRMCLRDITKRCNKCHECDIETDEWYNMSR